MHQRGEIASAECATNLIEISHPLPATRVDFMTPKKVLNESGIVGAVLEYRALPTHASGATVSLSSATHMSYIRGPCHRDGLTPSGSPCIRSGCPVFCGCTPTPPIDRRGRPSILLPLLIRFCFQLIQEFMHRFRFLAPLGSL